MAISSEKNARQSEPMAFLILMCDFHNAHDGQLSTHHADRTLSPCVFRRIRQQHCLKHPISISQEFRVSIFFRLLPANFDFGRTETRHHFGNFENYPARRERDRSQWCPEAEKVCLLPFSSTKHILLPPVTGLTELIRDNSHILFSFAIAFLSTVHPFKYYGQVVRQ